MKYEREEKKDAPSERHYCIVLDLLKKIFGSNNNQNPNFVCFINDFTQP
jgi:hypothetical protein